MVVQDFFHQQYGYTKKHGPKVNMMMWETLTLLFWFDETSMALSTFRTSKCTGSGLSTFYIRFAAISVVIQILQTVRPFKLWH